MKLLSDLFSGAVIGVANIIPGVSGGTMALVLGIYEKLLSSISNISINTFLIFLRAFTFKKDRIELLKSELVKINATFMICILVGALAAIVSLAKVMSVLLVDFHDPTYGFFFGLVLLSALSPYKLINNKTFRQFLIIVFAAIIVIFISDYISSGDKLVEKAILKASVKSGVDAVTIAPINKIYVIFLGAISISAMILPGVSGSFLLLLLGGYFPVLKAISERDLLFLSLFAFGCIMGLFIFTKLLNFLLTKAYDSTMSFLVGLVIGSLWMIWPFKRILVVNGEKIYLNNIIPSVLNINEIITFCAILSGMFIVYLLILIEKKNCR